MKWFCRNKSEKKQKILNELEMNSTWMKYRIKILEEDLAAFRETVNLLPYKLVYPRQNEEARKIEKDTLREKGYQMVYVYANRTELWVLK